MTSKVPQRDFGSKLQNDRLPPKLSIVGLGCSSFSTFFWTEEELASDDNRGQEITADTLSKDHPRVQEWIATILYAVNDCGINFLDTAPWYGHGTSEVAIGFAMENGLKSKRNEIYINTKVGRYEAEPSKQFDFSKATTLLSIQRSLKRMKCDYIDCLQLHDPEFAPSIDQLMKETIPAMLEAREKGWCRSLGMTGYPLRVQYQILQRSLEVFGPDSKVWDQALTYGHFNLHDTSLMNKTIHGVSFADYCETQKIGMLAAAPLSMGLLTHQDPPEWHPADQLLQLACFTAKAVCSDHDVNISSLATLFALSEPRIASTIIGCKNIGEVERAAKTARRFHFLDDSNSSFFAQEAILSKVLTENESKAMATLQDAEGGPFAELWKTSSYSWDGIQEAHRFRKSLDGNDFEAWQESSPLKE